MLFLKLVLEQFEHVIVSVPDNIVGIYTSYQPMYDRMLKVIKPIKFIEGLPDSFDDETLFPSEQTHLIILDDVIFQASNHPEVVNSLRYMFLNRERETACQLGSKKCPSDQNSVLHYPCEGEVWSPVLFVIKLGFTTHTHKQRELFARES